VIAFKKDFLRKVGPEFPVKGLKPAIFFKKGLQGTKWPIRSAYRKIVLGGTTGRRTFGAAACIF
jgi:hypothetical protein